MKTGKKRWLALLLSLAMCFVMTYNCSFASDVGAEQDAAAAKSDSDSSDCVNDAEYKLFTEGYDDEDDEDYDDDEDDEDDEDYEDDEDDEDDEEEDDESYEAKWKAWKKQKQEEVNAAVAAVGNYKESVSGDIYSGKVVFDRKLYTLEVTFTETDDGDVMKGVVKPKTSIESCGLSFRFEAIYWRGIGEEDSLEQKDSDGYDKTATFEYTLDYGDFKPGCNYIRLKMVPELKQDQVQGYYDFDSLQPKELGLEDYYSENIEVNISDNTVLDVSKVTSKEIALDTRYPLSDNVKEHGIYVWFRKKGAGKWQKKTFKAGKTIRFKGLSPAAAYEIQGQEYVKSVNLKGKVETILFKKTKKETVKTALAKAPAIKSVKTQNVKQFRMTSGGYTDSNGTWHPPMDVWFTTFDLKIVFKSKPKGAVGYIISTPWGAKAIKTGKNSVTIADIRVVGKEKGQKRTIKAVTYSALTAGGKQTGISPVAEKTFTVK